MMVMPDYAVHLTYEDLLPEDVEEQLLDLLPGSVISHPGDGGTVVAVPITVSGISEAARDLPGWTDKIARLTGVSPSSLSVDPLE